MPISIPNLASTVTYLNPTHVKVYVGEYWLDDVVDIHYEIQDMKEPLYGFKSTLFDAVGIGKTIVRGSVTCLYRYPGYLARVLDKITAPDQKTNRRTVGSPLTEKSLTTAGESAAELLRDTFKKDPKKGIEMSKQLTYIFLNSKPPGASRASQPGPRGRAGYIQGEENKRFDLRLVYGRMDSLQRKPVQQVIQDVLLIGEGQSISVLDGQGDSCLYETYSFMARNVVLS